MLFSCAWLSQYVDLPGEPAELARRLTSAGFAVERVEAAEGADTVLDVDVTTNRVDAMNHLGLAREIAVLFGVPLRRPAPALSEGDEATSGAVTVRIDAPDLCTRYAARVIRGVKVGPSPDWLARRLTAIGQRPINNVVDVTNYVLWETGQPLHGFDLARIAGATILVRRAKAGERLTTLDGVERKLEPGMLVIADAARPVGLAGVMGGEASEVGSGTTDVLLESAWFNQRSVRATAKRLGMHTDASHRFERGADPELQGWAADRAAALIAEVAGGIVLAGAVDVQAPDHESLHRPPTIHLDLDRLDAFGGVRVPEGRPAAWLSGLGFGVEQAHDAAERALAVTVPSWRLGDVFEAADLYEEVLRVHGFDTIPATLPAIGEPDAPATPRQSLRRRVRRTLAAAGYAEAITWAFQSAEEAGSVAPLASSSEGGAAGEAAVVLANPLSELYSTLRRSLLPGLVADARFNTRRGAESVRLFEIANAFARAASGEVIEREAVGLVCGGTVGTPWQRQVELDLFDLKGAVEAVASAAGKTIEARPAEVAGLLPGTSAELVIDGRPAGRMGRLASDENPYPLYLAEVELAALEMSAEELHEAFEVEMPPRLPGIEVDFTLTHSLDLPWAEIEAAVRTEAAPELRRARLKVRYTGEGVPAGAVNTTLTFLYHGGERQLTQEEVNRHQEALAATLQERFGWAATGAGEEGS
jgi:phenylalanyl-tRNA synthetase beta chain